MRVSAPVLVRDAGAADAAAIGEVHAEAWRVSHRDLFESRWLAAFVERRRGAWRDRLAAQRPDDVVLVAQRGDRVVAFAWYHGHPDNRHDAELCALYAHPTAWGTGVAQALVDDVLLGATAYRRIRLWTLFGATRARRFYTRAGFAETGLIRERDYGDGRPVLEVEYARRPAQVK
ncbi:RimJ/RimL family protein N-acetyltransferase [Actinokineospora baliensis]|uniref:GNAT family N-acetyltransferase n=1 Tax=Actinokineospora baliensis TaxID=547056 RepID=UPI00195CCB8E|nr:GNAT family N-acetyltransferase [Actinokineospora baliensis]MBM7772451.1 RimJ/RimL family protein N-acetyltransferase [Actinokineospora baliensis]